MNEDKIKGLKKRDTFFAKFGFSTCKFIVVSKNGHGVVATMPSWMKSDGQYLSFERLKNDPYFSIGNPYSKFRYFFKF